MKKRYVVVTCDFCKKEIAKQDEREKYYTLVKGIRYSAGSSSRPEKEKHCCLKCYKKLKNPTNK